MVLRFSWMQTHDLQFSWKEEITRWSAHCHEKCLQVPLICITSTTIEIPESHSQVEIPHEYHEFKEVFSKGKSSGLPSHCPYDRPIELLARATPLHNHIYPLSIKETQVMSDYIKEALQQGYIAP